MSKFKTLADEIIKPKLDSIIVQCSKES